jgi:hypothetical protein
MRATRANQSAAATIDGRAEGARTRPARRQLSAEQAAIAIARAQVWVYLSRGKISKTPCACGRRDVVPTWADVSRPLEVVWRCRAHASDYRREQRERRSAPTAPAQIPRDEAAAQLAALPADARSRVLAFAAQLRVGGFTKQLDPESPLYRLRLAEALARENAAANSADDVTVV